MYRRAHVDMCENLHRYMGPAKLYCLILDQVTFLSARSSCNKVVVYTPALAHLLPLQSKSSIAKALRVFVDPDNYPVLVHCIHGASNLASATTHQHAITSTEEISSPLLMG